MTTKEIMHPNENPYNNAMEVIMRSPKTDIFEGKDSVKLYVSMPGVKKENIHLGIENDYLFVEGKIATEKLENLKPLFVEYHLGGFQRKFLLGKELDKESVNAQYNNGILEITIEKALKKNHFININ